MNWWVRSPKSLCDFVLTYTEYALTACVSISAFDH